MNFMQSLGKGGWACLLALFFLSGAAAVAGPACSLILLPCLLRRTVFFSAAGKESLDQNDVGIAIADCSE